MMDSHDQNGQVSEPTVASTVSEISGEMKRMTETSERARRRVTFSDTVTVIAPMKHDKVAKKHVLPLSIEALQILSYQALNTSAQTKGSLDVATSFSLLYPSKPCERPTVCNALGLSYCHLRDAVRLALGDALGTLGKHFRCYSEDRRGEWLQEYRTIANVGMLIGALNQAVSLDCPDLVVLHGAREAVYALLCIRFGLMLNSRNERYNKASDDEADKILLAEDVNDYYFYKA